MEKEVSVGLVPVFTSEAGACLTAANWFATGITVAAFSMNDLLIRPGYHFLRDLSRFASYSGFSGQWVLNLSQLKFGVDNLCTLRSPLDGSRIQHSVTEIVVLMAHLQPDWAILPEGLWRVCQSLPDSVGLFVPVKDVLEDLNTERPYGIYVACDEGFTESALLDTLLNHRGKQCYFAGDISGSLMTSLIKEGAFGVESDKPARDAYQGRVYGDEGELSLEDISMAEQFEVIDWGCLCPVCRQPFTRAYLHHLLSQTPLLCQRLLVQHNVYYVQSRILSFTG